MARRDLTFRVFVSSTFSDLVAERNALQEQTFPKLRDHCQQRGARFQAFDLRWGVSEEAALDQQTMNICMDELKRCQAFSPRPNFIILLGNRYGWRPLQSKIEAREFEELLSQVPDLDKPLLAGDGPVPIWRGAQGEVRVGWYRKDLNSVPTAYVLQPRTIGYPQDASEDARRRNRQEETRDWATLERRMRTLLMEACDSLGWPADEPRRFKYETSATHQEIRAGALEVEDPQRHVLCYFRDIDGLPAHEHAAVYRDVQDDAVDADAERRLSALKTELESILRQEHVHKYRAVWNVDHPEYDLQNLCDDVERDLKAIIDREIASFQHMPGFERERETHREFAEERSRCFVGRQDILKRIQTYLDSDDRRPLIIHGRSGSGKTAIMAQAAHQFEPMCAAGTSGSKDGAESPQLTALVYRFVGATPGSSDLRTLLGDLCRELGVAEVPQAVNDLVREFRSILSPGEQENRAEDTGMEPPDDERRILMLLDALDQLNPTDNARMLYWMPRELRPNVKMIVSVLENGKEGGAHAVRQNPYDLARRIWPESLVEVGALDDASSAGLLDSWLQDAGRTLQPEQRTEVLHKASRCPLPLYLKLLAEEARRWKSWEGVAESPARTIEGVLEKLFERLERPENHGKTFVSRSLGYIRTAKNGLTEDELLDVLSKDREVMEGFSRSSPESPPVHRLPVIVWSRLLADIRSYMNQRRVDGTVAINFYHREVSDAVRRRYLAEDSLLKAHLHLAEYFSNLGYWAESPEAQRARARRLPPTPRPANVRKVVELPYHRLQVAKLAGKNDPESPHWDAVANLLTNWQFLEAKAEADPDFQERESYDPSNSPVEHRAMIFELAEDFHDAVMVMPPDHPRHRMLRLLEEAIRRDMYFIARHPTTLFQCMWNTCWWHDCPEAEKYRVPTVPEGRPLSYEGSSISWSGFACFLLEAPWSQVWFHSLDRAKLTIRRFAARMHHKKQGCTPPRRLHVFLDQWHQAKADDAAGFTWLRSIRPPRESLESALRSIFRGHEGAVNCLVCSPDNNWIVSAGNDAGVRVWPINGGFNPLILRGHSKQVLCLACSPSGVFPMRLASGGADGIICVWDLESGRQAFAINAHRGAVTALDFSSNGQQVLSAGVDRMVRIWSVQNGEQLSEHSHRSPVMTASYVSAGRSIVVVGTNDVLILDNALKGTQDGENRSAHLYYGGLSSTPDEGIYPAHVCKNTGMLGLATSSDFKIVNALGQNKTLYTLVAPQPSGRPAFDSSGLLIALPVLRYVVLWDLTHRNKVRLLEGHPESVTSLAFTPDGGSLASGSRDGTIRVWSLTMPGSRFGIGDHERRVNALAFCCGGNRLATSSYDGTVRIWSTESGEQIHCWRGREVDSVIASSDGRRIAANFGASVWVWDAWKGRRLAKGNISVGRGTVLEFSPDGQKVVLKLRAGHLAIVATEPCRVTHHFVVHKDGVILCWPSDGSERGPSAWSVNPTAVVPTFTNDLEATRWALKQQMIREVRFLSNDHLAIALRGWLDLVESRVEDRHATMVVVWDISNQKPLHCIGGTDDLACIGVVPRRDPFCLLSSGNESVVKAEGSGVPVAWYNLTFSQTAKHPSLNTWAAAVDNHLCLLRLEKGARQEGAANAS